MQRVYTHDESDIQYREVTNRTDGAVKREHAIRYAEKIKLLRAQKEREAALDAFNYLNGKNLSVWLKIILFNETYTIDPSLQQRLNWFLMALTYS